MTLVLAGSGITPANLADGTDGELITWDASGNPASVAVGTATHVLTSNGAGAAPTFQAAAAAGGTLVETVATTSGSNIDMDHADMADTSYAWHRLILTGVSPSNSKDMFIRIAVSASYATTNYNWRGVEDTCDTVDAYSSGSDSECKPQGSGRIEIPSGETMDGIVDIHQRGSGLVSFITWCLWNPVEEDSIHWKGIGNSQVKGQISGIRFAWDTYAPTFDAGSISHYKFDDFTVSAPMMMDGCVAA